MMRCEEALARLWDFLDGELEPRDEEEVRRHLEVCRRCYPQYDFQRAYFALLRRVRDREGAPGELRRSLVRRLRAEPVEGGGPA